MKNNFTRLIETICFVSIASIISLSCGGGGGDGGGSTPTPTDNFGSIKTYSPVSESQSDEEFWTKERIDEAIKNPIVKKYKGHPNSEAIKLVPDGEEGSFPSFNPDTQKVSMLKYEKITGKEDSLILDEATIICPTKNYKLYYTHDYTSYPQRIMGGLFIKTSASTVGFCTASLINDRMILTAAHCVSDNSSWYSNFSFVPGFNNSSNWEPYGHFLASYVFVYSGWFDDEYYPADYAIIVLKKSIGNQLGYLGVFYNVPSDGKTFHQFGYPGEPIGDNMTLFKNVSDYALEDCSSEGPCRMVVSSPFNEGTSGGPWCLNLNNYLYANGVNSQSAPTCPAVVSPYFNDKMKDLYSTAKSYQ